MERNLNEITDSEIRVIGSQTSVKAGVDSGPTPTPRRHIPWWWILVGLVVFILVALAVSRLKFGPDESAGEEAVAQSVKATADGADELIASAFEPTAEPATVQPHPLQEWLSGLDTITAQATAVKELIVNDVEMQVMVPLNVIPHLEVGYACLDHKEQSVLFCQAADVRADNKKIVGAFVQQGKPLSWGLSKRGFCGIIDGNVTVGVADNSPLFEEATEKGGDFFRQYPLVDKGRLVESELKNKALRRALCEVDGHIVVVITQTPESMHDFAQALVDLGVRNAIYLVGSYAIGWCQDMDGKTYEMGQWNMRRLRNASFIVWRKTRP